MREKTVKTRIYVSLNTKPTYTSLYISLISHNKHYAIYGCRSKIKKLMRPKPSARPYPRPYRACKGKSSSAFGVVARALGWGHKVGVVHFIKDKQTASAALKTGLDMMASGVFDLIVLDEINIALQYDYLEIAQVVAGLEGRHKRTSVILTGRNAKEELMDYADLVTEMKEIKHPFKNAGIKAQRGIDF